MPFWKFVIQNQTCTATTAGIDQTRTSPAVRSTRTHAETRTSRNAMSVPVPIVRRTLAAVKITVRSNTRQKTSSWSTDV